MIQYWDPSTTAYHTGVEPNTHVVTYDHRYTHEQQHLLTYEYWHDHKAHTHLCEDITDLETTLASKAEKEHTHEVMTWQESTLPSSSRSWWPLCYGDGNFVTTSNSKIIATNASRIPKKSGCTLILTS